MIISCRSFAYWSWVGEKKHIPFSKTKIEKSALMDVLLIFKYEKFMLLLNKIIHTRKKQIWREKKVGSFFSIWFTSHYSYFSKITYFVLQSFLRDTKPLRLGRIKKTRPNVRFSIT